MTEVTALITSIIEVLKLASSVPGPWANRGDRGETVRRALREIYFTPNGVMNLIEQIIEQKTIDPDELKRVLGDFNDFEPLIQRHIEILDFEDNIDSLNLSIRTVKILNDLKYGKITLRNSIKRELNHYGQRGVTVDIGRLKMILRKIKELNALIEQLDERVG